MYKRRRGFATRLGLIMMLTAILTVAVGCSPTFELIIENQTEQTLTIYVNSGLVGDVEPGSQITGRAGIDIGDYIIKAKNRQGDVVFSEKYDFHQGHKYSLQRIDSRVWKAVIPPVGNGSESSDNATGN